MIKNKTLYTMTAQSKTVLVIASLVGLAMLNAGCQTTSSTQNTPTQPKKPSPSQSVSTPDGITITPYEREEIKRESRQVVIPQSKASAQRFDDGRNLPVFKQLISQTQSAFQQGKWSEAEQLALRAQRLAPQSAESFMYLAMIANQTNQAGNADALARRGLSYAQSTPMKRQLWQIILKSAQLRNNPVTIQEAQARIKAL
nr:tetratricopeptide repeat protein [Acinetobacter lanii]